MLFDHDPELGAILCVNHVKKQIRGYFYRFDELKQLYVMDVKGNWKPTQQAEDPFVRCLPDYLDSASQFMEERDKLNWLLACDWLEEGRIYNYCSDDPNKYDEEFAYTNQNIRLTREVFFNNSSDSDGGLQKYLDLLDTYEYITE